MAREIECPICGRVFETTKPNKRYCSFICREAGRNLKRLQWEDSHPGYNAEYAKEYRKRLKTK
ncbi:MAG: hypothetical protein II918_02520 [Firmicutes bacterium]|nr:hypothetical protein [Bacillota bacterium]